MKSWLFCCALLFMPIQIVRGDEMSRPAYPLTVTNKAKLEEDCAPFLKLSRTELLALVPPQAGFLFSGCPNCHGGSVETNLIWNIALGDKVQCKYCKATFPSAQYPENGEVKVVTPGGKGKEQVFHYYEDAKGKKYWFESRRWFEQRQLLEQACYNLVQLYAVDPVTYKEAGDRAAQILLRFATLFPSYAVHWEYPNDPKRIYADNVPYLKDGYRASKWSAWAFMDVSRPLLLAYDRLKTTDFLSAADRKMVESDLFGGMLKHVAQFDNTHLTNMHPTLWRSEITAAKVLSQPELIPPAINGIEQMLRDDFSYDGYWREGSVSYHLQTVGNLELVLWALRPDLKGAAFDEWLKREYPQTAKALNRANQASDTMRLPNGRYVGLQDSWAVNVYGSPIPLFKPTLLPGMGYATLGLGKGDAHLRANLNFNGRFGHEHFDSLNLFLFGNGAELISDIGYTHTIARPWATSTLGHNTVLIDQKNQALGELPDKARGNVLLYNADDVNFQAVEAEALAAYPGVASDYRRMLVTIGSAAGSQYVVDIFNVAGGKRHDWVLHGSADQDQALELADADGKPVKLNEVPSLLPAGYKFIPPKTEVDIVGRIFDGPWAYGNFSNIKGTASDHTMVATFRDKDDPKRGLRSWVLDAPASTYYTLQSPAVRGTGKPFAEDDSKLNQHFRSSVMVRREGSKDRFVAVHCPFTGDYGVRTVSQLPLLPGGTALKIERKGGTDYLFIGDDQTTRTGQDGDLKFTFQGRLGLARVEGTNVRLKMIGGTQLHFGTHVLTAPLPAPAKLLKVESNKLTVAGQIKAVPGDVIRIIHGDGHVTAFHIDTIAMMGDNTVIQTIEAPVLQGSAEGTLEMLTFPNLKLPAPHTLELDRLVAQP